MNVLNRADISHRVYKRLLAGRVVLWGIAFPILLSATLMGSLNSVRKMVLLFVGFGSVVFFHELGHFLAAKSFGIRCDVFALGIGPRLCGWRKGRGFSFGEVPIGPDQPEATTTESEAPHATMNSSAATLGETDYRLAWLPFGGYVRMLGQDDLDPTKISTDPASFGQKPIWQRMIVISAGVIMNLIFAVVLFAIIFREGVKFPPAIVGSVAWNSPAAKAGLHVGDKIVAINGKKPLGFLEFTDLGTAAALDAPGAPVQVTYTGPNGGPTHNASMVPVTDPGTGLLAFGIGETLELKTAIFSKKSLAALVKVKPEFSGMLSDAHVTSVNGIKLKNWAQFHDLIQASGGKTMHMTLVRTGKHPRTTVLSLRSDLALRDWVAKVPSILGMQPLTKIAAVLPGTPAEKAGVKARDVVLSYGDAAFPTTAQLTKLVGADAGKPVKLVLLRGDKKIQLTVTPQKGLFAPARIGVEMEPDYSVPMYGRVSASDSSAGMQAGGTFTGLTLGKSSGVMVGIQNWSDLVRVLRSYSGHTVQIHFAGKSPAVSLAFTGKDRDSLGQFTYELGLPLMPLRLPQKAASLGGAIAMGIDHTKSWILRTYLTLRGLGVGSISPHQLHSVIGIAKYGYEIESNGFMYLLFFLGLISVNLAVINFLPLPILDGGLFVLLIVEKFRGRPLPVKVQTAIQVAGIALIGGLFLYVTIFNDLPTLFGH